MNEMRQSRFSRIQEEFGNIINNTDKLLHLEVNHLRAQLKDDFKEKQDAGILIVSGILLALIGLVFGGVGLVQFLNTQTKIPLWGCQWIAAFVFLALSGLLFSQLKARQTRMEKDYVSGS